VIEREAFIGPHVVVLTSDRKGVRIGEGAVVGAGCVVSRNVPPRAVVVAAPTRVAGYATVSLATTDSIEEFWAGLKPPAAKARKRTPAGANTERRDVPAE
jgi:serine acetyltransferase